MLREQRAEGLAEGRAEGRAEGEARGKADGSKSALAAALLQLLTGRFGTIPDATRSRIQSADTIQLQSWFAKAIHATSIDDTLAE